MICLEIFIIFNKKYLVSVQTLAWLRHWVLVGIDQGIERAREGHKVGIVFWTDVGLIDYRFVKSNYWFILNKKMKEIVKTF